MICVSGIVVGWVMFMNGPVSIGAVNMGKGDFQFAAAYLIPNLMQEFNRKFLTNYTPCNGMDEEKLIDALAIVHIEYILVHPY